MTDPAGAKIAEAAPDLLAAKARLPWPRTLLLAVAAGAFIGFGSIGFLVVQAVPGGPAGPAQLLSGAAFSVGLLLVMIAGAELFTGNTMFVLPAAEGDLGAARVALSWTIVWLGNLLGSVAVAALFVAAGGLEGVVGEVGRAAARVAEGKLDKAPLAILASGVLANMLVCLAVWMAMGATSVAGKALAIVGPVTVFVAAGFEHSIANMSILPIGLLAGAEAPAAAVATNLALSTLGNILGGATVALILARGHGALKSGDPD